MPCKDCKFYAISAESTEFGTPYRECRRFPKPIRTSAGHWCGEYRSCVEDDSYAPKWLKVQARYQRILKAKRDGNVFVSADDESWIKTIEK